MENPSRFVVMTASAPTKSSWKWRHPRRRVAVVECSTPGIVPRQIHPLHKAVARIVRTWECLFVGETDRCQYARALAEAEELAEAMNDVLYRAAREAAEQVEQDNNPQSEQG